MKPLLLPYSDGSIQPFRFSLGSAAAPPARRNPNHSWNRIVYAAAHVVNDKDLAGRNPWIDANVDWEATLAYREYLWDLDLGVAEAMDTAQRGMGLAWENSLELIKRSVAAAKRRNALVCCGVGTDHLPARADLTLDDVRQAYEEQIMQVEAIGGRIILMASRALATCARGPDDYAAIYDSILVQLREPTILHWLGDMFDETLCGYRGSNDLWAAMEYCLAIIHRNANRIEGIKVSLLSPEIETAMRRRLPDGIRMFTGDDFNFVDLISGDEFAKSDAILGVFDPIAPLASRALTALSAGDKQSYKEILAPTIPLARHIFKEPTRFYKTDVTFLAYLNGQYYQQNRSDNPTGPAAGELKVFRGGSWNEDPEVARSAGRNAGTPDRKSYLTGLRCAWDIHQRPPFNVSRRGSYPCATNVS